MFFYVFLPTEIYHENTNILIDMRKVFCALLCWACSVCAQAQDELLKLRLETRVDYQREYVDGEANHDNSGFKGKYFMLSADGHIGKHFSYAYRQRLNNSISDGSFFDATDWAYIKYRLDDHWSFSGGKEVVAIGGYEYDMNPINVYFASEYWNNIAPFQFGVSIGYTPNGGKDRFTAQVSESIYRKNAPDMYSYNLMWIGSHGWFNTMYSANLVEYMPGKYISYIALGHRLNFGRVSIDADFMNRASSGHTYFFKDCSVIVNLNYSPIDKLNLFGKMSYDVNKTDKASDYSVMPGTEMKQVGGGLEYRPIKSVRLHAAYAHAFGKNGNEEGTLKPGKDWASVGVTWDLNLLSLSDILRKLKD